MISDNTYCMGYWAVEGNVKRSIDYYAAAAPETCEMIRGGNLILFHDGNRVADTILHAAKSNDIMVEEIEIPIENLPGYGVSDRLLRCCKRMSPEPVTRNNPANGEKGIIHYWREYRDSGESAYRKIIGIWMSKIPLVAKQAIDRNPFSTTRFTWIDVTVSRFTGARSNWAFMQAALPADKMSHYRSPMRFRRQQLPINASFMSAAEDVWGSVDALFERKLNASYDDDYAHDEETILGACHAAAPDLFHEIGRP